MTEATAQVVFVSSRNADAADERYRKRLMGIAQERGWRVKVYRVGVATSVAAGEAGRRLRVMEPHDAHDLYRSLHQRESLVVQQTSCDVLSDPSEGPKTRNLVRLADFVDRKALHVLGFDRPEPHNVLNSFDEWIETSRCEGEVDARCLPMHVFAPGVSWGPLESVGEVDAFERDHGRASQLRDSVGRAWDRATAFHGGGAAVVAGTELRQGFHWDVQGIESTRIFNSIEVWKFRKKSYMNIYPDSNFRIGNSIGRPAFRTYVEERPADSLRQSKTPQPAPRGKKGRGSRKKPRS